MTQLLDTPAAHRRFRIEAEEDVGVLRRAVRAQAVGLPGLAEGEAELVATELATNILRHAGGGYVLTRAGVGGVEMIAVDRGPGLPMAVREVLAAPRIAPSATVAGRAGLGVGLASVRRRAKVFDYHSDDRGTVILVRLGMMGAKGAWVWGGVNVPLGGEGPSGDAFAIAADGRLCAVLVDGIGHGPDAAVAAHAAIVALENTSRWADDGTGPEEWLTGFITGAHHGLRGTRGAVLGACVVDPDAGRAVFCGIGNITGRVHTTAASPHLVSHPGTLGAEQSPPRIRPVSYPWNAATTLIMASDGIDTRWEPADHPGLTRRHPTVIAAVLHRDHARGRDDAAMLVVRASGAEQETM
jgi:anti-sigma regulatory factor (Ser/Thr protein kinase)